MSLSNDRSARGTTTAAVKANHLHATSSARKRGALAWLSVLLVAFSLQGAPAFASSAPESTPPSTTLTQPGWEALPPTLYGRLYGLYAVSPQDIWAVGSKVLIATTGTLIMHYDGTSWTEVTSIPWVRNPQRLNGVAATGPADAWAVGTEGPKTVAVHWDGASWNASDATPPTPTPLPTQTPNCQANFTDVTPDDDYYAFVSYLYCRGIIEGYEDGTFRPANPVTRGQLAKMVIGTYNLPLPPNQPPVQHFSDVPPSSPFFDYVEAAYLRGLVSGYADGTFRPQNTVTRGQLAKVVASVAAMRDPAFWQIVNAHGPAGSDPYGSAFPDVPPGSPFYRFVETAAAHNAVSGYEDGTYRPLTDSSRSEVATVLYMAVFNAPAYSLNGVTGVTSSNVWAAGTDGVNPMVLHYNGSTWERTTLPAPLGVNGRLSDIRVTPGGLLAVGSYSTALPNLWVPPLTEPDRSSHSLMLMYDAATTRWTRPTPPGASRPASTLLGAASTGGSAWAVGASEPVPNGGMSPTALRSGQQHNAWSLLSPPAEQDGTTLASVTVGGASDVWVAGWSGTPFPTLPSASMYAAHYDGATWAVAALPVGGDSSRLMGICSISAHEAWAVGYSGQGPNSLPLILHYLDPGGNGEK